VILNTVGGLVIPAEIRDCGDSADVEGLVWSSGPSHKCWPKRGECFGDSCAFSGTES